jgi:5-formyltetrahydrofolate cyclo-ligase
MAPTKDQLRLDLRQRRLGIDKSERQESTNTIVNSLKQAIDWENVSSVHFFEVMEGLGEIDLSKLIGFLSGRYEDLSLYTNKKVDGKWAISQVRGNKKLLQFDVILVPMLGFDGSLNRIGYGGGYYDKFLALQPNSLKVGVSYEATRVNQILVEAHDISMDIIVTEKSIYR